MTQKTLNIELGETKWTVAPPTDLQSAWKITRDGKTTELHVDAKHTTPGTVSLLHDGHSYTAWLESAAGESYLHIGETRVRLSTFDPRSLATRRGSAQAGAGVATLRSPMPGRVVRVLCQPGDIVEVKQGLLVVEAMKMQNELKAPKAGAVGAVLVSPGDTVAANQPLITIL